MSGSNEVDVAAAFSQSRSMQGLVRVLNLFGAKYPGMCCFNFVRESAEGVEIDFGAHDKAASEHGLRDMTRMLALTDELMLLEAMISNLRDRQADAALISDLIDDAHKIIKQLYPDVEIVDGAAGNA